MFLCSFFKVVVSFDGRNEIADHLRLRFIQIWESKIVQSSEQLSVSTHPPFYNFLHSYFFSMGPLHVVKKLYFLLSI